MKDLEDASAILEMEYDLVNQVMSETMHVTSEKLSEADEKSQLA